MARPRVLIAAFALLLGAVGISASFAQPYPANGYFSGGYHASTAAEGAGYGRASVIRSQGQFLLDSSQAATQFEQARSANIDNRYKATQAYFEMQQMNQKYRDAKATPASTQEDLIRWAQAGTPKPLTSSELNPHNGELLWPIALTSNVFAADRTAVDQLMAERAKYGALNFDQVLQLQAHVDSMKAGLKDRIQEYKPNTYLEAKNFLVSMAYEVRQ